MLKRAFEISAAGLSAQRARMEAVASNLANAKTTRTDEGGPYRRRSPVFAARALDNAAGRTTGALRSVRVASIALDPSPPLLRFEPGHPDADASGFVAYPNVDPVREMVDMLSATRSYEANVTLLKNLRGMFTATLDIVR